MAVSSIFNRPSTMAGLAVKKKHIARSRASILSLSCFLLLLVAAMADTEEVVTVSIVRDAPKAQVDDDYICATLDWWPPQKCDYGRCSWDHASLLNLDLTNQLLENAVKAFSPLKLRLGGSLQDLVVYHLDKLIKPCVPFYKNQSAMFGFSGGCLPMWRWDALNQFFQKTGSTVAFGLNALYGRKRVKGIYGPWDSTNARDFIQYSFNHGYKIQAWEFGNELSGSGVGTSVPANQYAADVKELHAIVNNVYCGQQNKPLIVSPDGFYDKKWFQAFLKISGPVVNVVSHHIYNLGAGVDEHLVEKILDPAYLDKEATTFASLRSILMHYGPWASAWVGEAGGAYNSGHHLVTDAFVFGFWYLDQLGMAAKFGTKSYCRQSLVGGNYGLLNTTTYHPNPDYYGALLWHRLMGNKVLSTKTLGSPYLRAYAHCTKKDNGVTLLLLNMNKNTSYKISISMKDLFSSRKVSWKPEVNFGSFSQTVKMFFSRKSIGLSRQEFHLTAKNANLRSQTVVLNGKPLEVTADGQIPELTPKIVGDSLPLTIAPLSIAFVSLPLQIPACSK